MGRKAGSKNKVKSVEAIKELTSPCVVKVKRERKIKEVPDENTYSEIPLPFHVVRGYVNVQANPLGGWYLGCDIHETIEKAKSVASKQTFTQIYVAFEVKG